jgi:hypothetical protein
MQLQAVFLELVIVLLRRKRKPVPPVVNTLWIGGPLGNVERACLRSAMRQGHAVRLFCYEPIRGVPEGVLVADAAAILPSDRIIRYENGSVALFANLFRYMLQREGCGLWADTDHYFLKPHDFPEPYVFGRLQNGRLANGVLKMPSDCPLLTSLLKSFDGIVVPPWANGIEREKAQTLLESQGNFRPEDMAWGFTGPRALTHLARELGLDGWAKATQVFYPADFTESDWLLDPSRSLDDAIAPDTVGIHLWNQKIKGFKNEPAPRGSFLARLQDEGR